jgi:hypothetical protein
VTGERWIKVALPEERLEAWYPAVRAVLDAYYAAEAQRVETIRWCATHGCRATYFPRVCDHPEWHADPCEIVDGATLILPPEAAS